MPNDDHRNSGNGNPDYGQLDLLHSASARNVLLPDSLEAELKDNKGQRRAIAQRLGAFADWLDQTGRQWTTPDLAQYRDSMLDNGRSAATVNAHLSTIRSRYRDLLAEKRIRQGLMTFAAQTCERYGWEQNAANIKAARDLITEELHHALAPRYTSAHETTKQDDAEETYIRLTNRQANTLMAAPGTATLPALRDTAVIALALATGARAAELSALEVGDHKIKHHGELALLIRKGKGNKQRVVYYGEQQFVIAIVDAWLKHANITEGPVFRGFFRGGRKVRKTPLTVVTIENIVSGYPIIIDGELRNVKPHDLRRTYARLMYLDKMPLVAIQQNLGHVDTKTTLAYIGQLDKERVPDAVLSFDLSALADL